MAYEYAFGPFPKHLKILHHCDNRACQNPAHLFLGTQTDNVADMVAKGRRRVALGEDVGLAKLTVGQVRAIFADPRSQSTIAKDYGVAQTTISRIKLRQTWAHATIAWATSHGVKLRAPDAA